MIQEDRELLLKDLSARLPYGVKVIERSVIIQTLHSLENAGKTWYVNPLHEEHGNISPLSTPIEECKPYLRSMESMTEDEQRTLDSMCNGVEMVSRLSGLKMFDKAFDWLNAHHFDYRGLIEKGLALESTEGMYD